MWYRIDCIPADIQKEAVEILTTGMVSTDKRVRESADWTAFMLVQGRNELYPRKKNREYRFATEKKLKQCRY